MRTVWNASLLFVLGLCIPAVSAADEGKDESGKGYEKRGGDGYAGRGDTYFDRHGYQRLEIPKGHYPAPGECRIWYPERSAGQQPPPGRCETLRRHVPRGAWLIEHPQDDIKHVRVVVYDEYNPATISVVGQFEIGSGNFVRILFNK